MTTNIKPTEINQEAGKTKRFVPGILTYGSLQPLIFRGAERVDQVLREQAKEKDPQARNRRQPEIAYQWNTGDKDFWMRLYTTIDAKSLMTRAQRTGKAKIRLTVRDAKSKQVVEFVSGTVEIIRDERGWEGKVKELVDRAYLFVSRNRATCPLCRTAMEIRTGKRGQFWGCQTFPECRGTRNIPEAKGTEENHKPHEIKSQAVGIDARRRSPAAAGTMTAVQTA